eukprot:TRINITY_DN14643_c0_g1_i1.p1 TRINITY_DN14643_c0_g1~~TRINITY_DN14643_c0_g1_i1.p1  ORF type:complete len:817 (+),score=150.31 TRINITY_DN14643_c0_g1_i1:63-2453(+)
MSCLTTAALSEYFESLVEVEKHAKSSKSKRELVEADCLYKASELLGALQLSEGVDEVGLRMLLGASERTIGVVARYKEALRTPIRPSEPTIVLTAQQPQPQQEQANEEPTAVTLESLPSCLLDESLWAAKIMSSLFVTRHITQSHLEVMRLRGFLPYAVPNICKHSKSDDSYFGPFFNSLSMETSYHLLRDIIKRYASTTSIDNIILHIIYQAVVDYENSESLQGNIVNASSRIICDSRNVPKHEIRLLILSLYGPEFVKRGAVPESHITKAVRSVRHRVIAKFGDSRNLQGRLVGEDHLCMATIYFIERTPEKIIQSHTEGLLSGVLNGIQARLGSPIPGYRKLACIAARCLSFVIDPNNPIEFEDYPDAYEHWMDDEDGIGQASNSKPSNATTKRSKAKQLNTQIQEDPNDCAFSDSDSESQDGDDDDGNSFWSSDSETNEGSPEQDQQQTTRVTQLMYLSDVLKVIQGKREDVKELEQALSDLPLRLSTERHSEICSLGPQIFKSLLYLHNEFSSELFDEKRHESLLLLIASIPENTVAQCIDFIWSQHMGTAQRLEVLKLLGLAASRMRSTPINSTTAAGDENAAPPRSTYLKFGSRRKYPPTEETEADTIKNIVKERLSAKTRVIHKKRSQQEGIRNHFENHAPLFIYNLIGTWDSKHFNPFTAEDPMVLAELLRYLWGISELLEGCGQSGQFVLLSILAFLWEMRKHDLPLVTSLVVAAATTALLSLQEVSIEVASQWSQFAEDIIRGRVGKSDRACTALAANLLSAIQQQLDAVVGPVTREIAPKIEVL